MTGSIPAQQWCCVRQLGADPRRKGEGMSLRNITKTLILGLTVTSIALLAAPQVLASVQECEVIDFEQFTHAEGITSISLFGGDITIGVTAFRNSPGGVVNATAYDTDYSLFDGGCANFLDGSHNDTQIPASIGLATPPGFCANCDGIVTMVPDVDFCTAGDDTQGGNITFSGFSNAFTWEIPSYQAVDADDSAQDILLRVGAGNTLVGSTNCDLNPACGDGEVVTVTTNAHSFTEVAEFTLEGSGGIDNIQVCRTSEPPGEGCTPGYWKNHLEDWPPTGFAPTDDFDTVFGTGYFSPDITLGDAVRLGGGGVRKLARHGTAALLSAAHPDVSYPFSVAEVIALVQAGDVDPLVSANELGCEIP